MRCVTWRHHSENGRLVQGSAQLQTRNRSHKGSFHHWSPPPEYDYVSQGSAEVRRVWALSLGILHNGARIFGAKNQNKVQKKREKVTAMCLINALILQFANDAHIWQRKRLDTNLREIWRDCSARTKNNTSRQWLIDLPCFTLQIKYFEFQGKFRPVGVP